jgi:CheY-like chemotaxis protein
VTALREDSQHKDEFLAMLAHELRNPLAPITNAVTLLRHGTTEDVDGLHAMIERQSARLVRLVDELLDIARINRGLIELKRATVNLTDVASQAAEASRPRIETRGHLLTLNLGSDAVWVNGDSVRLEQVISNLLDNAAKYTEPGGQIALALASSNGSCVLRVRDNGIGISAVDQRSIFDLFKQVNMSPSRSGSGLGIGLTLVRRVVELHGGTISVHSAGIGHGSEFRLKLPVTTAPEATVGADDSKPSESGTTRQRVLIVDDNADSLTSLAQLVRAWGHEVAIAPDGSTALSIAASFAPQVALVDIGLPGMDGFELGRHLKESGNGDPPTLIAVTGYGRDEDRREIYAAGFSHHLVKPADPEELRALLASI